MVTLAIGDFYEELGALTHPLLRQYAVGCSADFIVLDSRKLGEEHGLPIPYEKLQVFDLLDRYDRIVFIDTDIVVLPDAPSLFEQCPPDILGAVSEEEYARSDRDKTVTQDVLGPVDWVRPYFNTGVMVVPRVHRELLDPAAPGLLNWATGEFREQHINLLNDQPYLNHRANALELPFIDLNRAYNFTCAHPDGHRRFRQHLIHYSGPSGHRYGPRLEQIARDVEIATDLSRLESARRHPRLRWLLDRCHPGFVEYLLVERLGIGRGAGRPRPSGAGA